MQNVQLISLIKKFKNHDMSAFAEIYCEFENLMHYYAHRCGGEDAFQEFTVFLLELLYKINLENFRTSTNDTLKRYIAVSIKNKYISLLRENQNKEDDFLKFENCFYEISDSLEREILKEALSTLSKKQRAIIIYKYIYNYGDVEIANCLDISRQAVNRLKNRAIDNLREYYEYGI